MKLNSQKYNRLHFVAKKFGIVKETFVILRHERNQIDGFLF